MNLLFFVNLTTLFYFALWYVLGFAAMIYISIRYRDVPGFKQFLFMPLLGPVLFLIPGPRK